MADDVRSALLEYASSTTAALDVSSMVRSAIDWWHRRRQERNDNFSLLRSAADHLGPQFEAESYERLIDELDCSEGELEWRGIRVRYTAQSYDVKANGDLCFCIDVYAGLPTPFGGNPSYRFVKRRDGSVYY